ncbi:MAG: hypothetical protein NTX87_10365 [Planctomycetota bacterium]|nr:hypothetical protein [Planctomycetota bacterium]
MPDRPKSEIRFALAARDRSREVRRERLGRPETRIAIGDMDRPFTVCCANVKGLYNQAGSAYDDFVTDGFIAFLKCRRYSLSRSEEGPTDIWIACRKDGWFGLLASGDDASFGVEVDDKIAYLPSRLPVPVPGQAEGVYFAGVYEPMHSSHLSGANECDIGFWAVITAATETPGEYTFLRCGGEMTGTALELNGNTGVTASAVSGLGAVVRIFSGVVWGQGNRTWTFEYDGSGVWATLGAYASGSYAFTADLGSGNQLTGIAFEVNGVENLTAGTQVRLFRGLGFDGYWQFECSGPGGDGQSFWGTITDNANAPVYELDGGLTATEVNGVLGIANGTHVRVFTEKVDDEDIYTFEYDCGMEILDSFDFIEVWPALVKTASASPLSARIWIPGSGFPPATGDDYHLTAANATVPVAYDQVGEGTFADGTLIPCLKDYDEGEVEDWIQVRCQQGAFTTPNAATPVPPNGHINTFSGTLVDTPLPYTLNFEYRVAGHWKRLTSTRTVNAAAGFEITLQGQGADTGCYSVRNKTWSVTLGDCPPTGTTMRLRYIPVSVCAWSWVQIAQTIEGGDCRAQSTLGHGWFMIDPDDRKLCHASPRPCAYEGTTNNCAIYIDECGHIMGWYVWTGSAYVWYSPWGREEPS